MLITRRNRQRCLWWMLKTHLFDFHAIFGTKFNKKTLGNVIKLQLPLLPKLLKICLHHFPSVLILKTKKQICENFQQKKHRHKAFVQLFPNSNLKSKSLSLTFHYNSLLYNACQTTSHFFIRMRKWKQKIRHLGLGACKTHFDFEFSEWVVIWVQFQQLISLNKKKWTNSAKRNLKSKPRKTGF